MKKIFKIFLIFLILAGIFIIDLPNILSFFSIDTKLKDYLVKTINATNEEVISIDNIDISFWKIELSDIRIMSSTANTQFVLKNAKFSYNIWKLITNPSSPQNAITEVVFIEPKLIIKNMDLETNIKSEDLITLENDKYDFLENFTQFEGIDKILLQDARIIYRKNSGEFIILAEDLNGWLRKEKNSRIMVNTTGSILYGHNNFNLHCDINLVDEILYGRIELANYHINNTKFLINQNDFAVESGILDGRIYLAANSFNMDSLFFSGYVHIFDLKADFLQSTVKNFGAKLILNKNQLSLKDANGLYNDSPFNLSASIEDIFNPELIGELSSDQFMLSSLEPYIDGKGFNGSTVNINNHFKISASDTMAVIHISAPKISYNKELIENLSSSIKYENGKISVNRFNFIYLGFDIESRGEVNYHDGRYVYYLQGVRDFESHMFFDKLSNTAQFVDINLKGNIIQKDVQGNWDYRISGKEDTLLKMNGRVTVNNGLFNFVMNRSFDQDFIFSIQIANIFNAPEIKFGYVENLPFHQLTSRSWLKDLAQKYTFEGILVGPVNQLNTELKFYAKDNPDKAFILSASIDDLLEKKKIISGNWQFGKFNGTTNFQLGEDFLLGELNSGDIIEGKVDLNLQRQEQLLAFLYLNNLDINQFFSDTTFGGYGEISGKFNINGDLDNPNVQANFEGNKFVLNDIGYYKFDTHLTASDGYLEFDSLSVSLNNKPVLTGNAKIDLEKKSLEAQASGNQVDADYIFKTLFGENYIINGETDYKLSINGNYTEPEIAAQLNFKDGQLNNIAYDDLHIELRDSIPANANYLDYKNHLINIKKLVLIKNGQFHFEGNGTFPLYTNGNIDLDLQFDGDILSLIPNWSDFIIDGASFSTIFLSIAGTPENPRIVEGLVNIERGELWLADVAEHIDELNGKIVILKGSNRVTIQDLIASIDGNSLKINTVHNVTTSTGEKLEPWYFKDLDLDFGVLTLETPTNGIELYIPSLMVDGETGFITLSGISSQEKFYFAGPVKHPTARGSVTLSNSRISYPFPPKKFKEKDSTEEFLENMKWNILVHAGQDLKYERQISAFLGEVSTELIVNPGGDGMKFTGILNDNTFLANGSLNSDRGRLDYLDLNFRVESFGVEFDQSNQKPRVYGRAWTVVRDSIDAIPKTIYLELYAVDPETGQEISSAGWEDFRFRLVTADPTLGESQEQVLAYLGYSVENIQNKATDVGGAVTENYLIRPLLRPIERSLERYLGFDLVRFNSNIARNIFHVSLGHAPGIYRSKSTANNFNSNSPYLFLFESSEITVGKYLSTDLYFTYTGQLVANAINQENEYNFNHSFGLEYRFFKNILLELEYDREILNYYETYTNKPYLEDFKIRLRHSFSF